MKAAESKGFLARPVPAALVASRLTLRVLLVLNWVYGAAILLGLIASFAAEEPVMSALGVPPSGETWWLIQGMRAIALLGLAGVAFHYAILLRLFHIVESVQAREPFAAQNAARLQAIAWALLILQVLGLVIGGIASVVSTPEHHLHIGSGFFTGGWLAVLLLFVLARVFAEGARMRDDLEGVV